MKRYRVKVNRTKYTRQCGVVEIVAEDSATDAEVIELTIEEGEEGVEWKDAGEDWHYDNPRYEVLGSSSVSEDSSVLVCKGCGGHNVQLVVWYRPNTQEVLDDFGSWNNHETKWCEDCEDHVWVEYESILKEKAQEQEEE